MIERLSNVLVGAAILVAALWPGAQAQTLTKLQVTTPTTSLVFFPLYDDNFNNAYREFFPDAPPARTVCGVQLSGGCKVEIECVALA